MVASGPGGWHYGNMVQSFVSVTGKINTQYFTYSYGVRPVIKVKANSVLLSTSHLTEIR